MQAQFHPPLPFITMVRIRHNVLQGFWGFAIVTALLLNWNALRTTRQALPSLISNNPDFVNKTSTKGHASDWPGQPKSDISHPKQTTLVRIERGGVENPIRGARDFLLQHLDEFLEVYKNRPDKSNWCGIRLNHAFVIYMVAQRLSPTTIIESGINAGQSTYFFRKACPSAKIISIDPLDKPICEQSKRWMDKHDNEYLVGDDFVDFNDIDWGSRIASGDLDPSSTLVFIDDHVGFYTRFPTLMRYGFLHIINEDNYRVGEGATAGDRSYLSPKQMFRGRSKSKDTRWLFYNLEVYHEFPPLLSPMLSKKTSHLKKKEGGLLHASDDLRFIEEPLLRPELREEDAQIFRKIASTLEIDIDMKDSDSYNEWMSYNYICYCRLVTLAPRLAREWNLTAAKS